MDRKVFKLLHPITDDNGDMITEITARLLTIGEHVEAEESGEDEFDSLDIVFCTITGLSQAELDRLSVPDFNTVTVYIDEQRTQPAELFISEKLDPDNPNLLQPIIANGGEVVEQINLKVPTVQSIRLRDKQKGTDWDKAFWMNSYCTGIGTEDLKNLSMPDWLQLQVRISDFLSKPAVYFQGGT